MLAVTACELINTLVYKPGWDLFASDNCHRFEASVRVRIDYPCANSDREYARLGYPEHEPAETVTHGGQLVAEGTPTIRPEGKAVAQFTLMVDDVDDVVRLCYLLLCRFAQIDCHEAREFLRVLPTFWSPFHPHHTDGMKRWAAETGRPLEIVQQEDMTFGLA